MSDFFMDAPLSEVKAKIIEDGRIDREEVDQIRRRLVQDREVDRYEAEFMFAVNDAVKDADNHSGFEQLFIDAITSHVLDSGLHPGILHEDEWAWLEEKLMKDYDIGDTETRLLDNIAKKAGSVPAEFQRYLADLKRTAGNHDAAAGESEGLLGRLLRRLTG